MNSDSIYRKPFLNIYYRDRKKGTPVPPAVAIVAEFSPDVVVLADNNVALRFA